MAAYQRFEDLPVWQASADLAARLIEWASQPLLRGKGDLANQLQRAALSISNNVAEGFERGSTRELLRFIYISRGSAGETRSMLCVMERMRGLAAVTRELAAFKSDLEGISRQLKGWASSLQDSEIAGERYLNRATRNEYQSRQRRKVFLEQRRQFQEQMEERLKRKAQSRNPTDGETTSDQQSEA